MSRVLALVTIALLLLCGPVSAQAEPPSEKLLRLARALPPMGSLVALKDLCITVGNLEKPTPEIEGGYNFRTPIDLDRRSTDDPELKGRFPGLHLNLPLEIAPGDVNYLFLSDQPERITDDRLREDGSKGATGVYARASMPAATPIRVLIDHTDGTRRPLRYRLLWVPEDDGTLSVRKRGESAHTDSVRAGKEALARSLQVNLEPRKAFTAGTPLIISEYLLTPEQTLVSHLEISSTVRGQLFSVVSEADTPLPADLQTLEALPVLHSIVWEEEAQRLEKFLDPRLQPTRFNRILKAFQHARGHFQFPDRVATATYDVRSWSDAAHPFRIYSLFESIPGADVTTPRQGEPAFVDNRGKYGAHVGLKVHVKGLPPGCKRMAMLVLNPYAKFGGRHFVTDRRRRAVETLHLPFEKPGMIDKDQGGTLWIGDVQVGDTLEMWTEPMANGSVYLWYALLPIPEESAP